MDRRTINLCRRNDRDFKGPVLAKHLQELRVALPALPKLARVSDDNLLGTTLIQQHALHKGIRGHRSNLSIKTENDSLVDAETFENFNPFGQWH